MKRTAWSHQLGSVCCCYLLLVAMVVWGSGGVLGGPADDTEETVIDDVTKEQLQNLFSVEQELQDTLQITVTDGQATIISGDTFGEEGLTVSLESLKKALGSDEEPGELQVNLGNWDDLTLNLGSEGSITINPETKEVVISGADTSVYTSWTPSSGETSPGYTFSSLDGEEATFKLYGSLNFEGFAVTNARLSSNGFSIDVSVDEPLYISLDGLTTDLPSEFMNRQLRWLRDLPIPGGDSFEEYNSNLASSLSGNLDGLGDGEKITFSNNGLKPVRIHESLSASDSQITVPENQEVVFTKVDNAVQVNVRPDSGASSTNPDKPNIPIVDTIPIQPEPDDIEDVGPEDNDDNDGGGTDGGGTDGGGSGGGVNFMSFLPWILLGGGLLVSLFFLGGDDEEPTENREASQSGASAYDGEPYNDGQTGTTTAITNPSDSNTQNTQDDSDTTTTFTNPTAGDGSGDATLGASSDDTVDEERPACVCDETGCSYCPDDNCFACDPDSFDPTDPRFSTLVAATQT